MSGYSLLNQLFSSNIPHILEAIFFNLDSESFKKCKEVCKTWNELLSSAPYQRRLENIMWQEAIESDDINKMRAHVRWQRKQIRRLLKRKLSSMENSSKWSIMLLWIMCSRVFEVIDVKEMGL